MLDYLVNVLSGLLQDCLQIFPEENLGRSEGVAVALVAAGVCVQDDPADLLGGGTPWDATLEQAAVP